MIVLQIVKSLFGAFVDSHHLASGYSNVHHAKSCGSSDCEIHFSH
jgi:hypothetical protein